MAESASMTNWSEGVDSAIFDVREASSKLMWRSGSRVCSELSDEVSTSSLRDKALAGPIVAPGVWFQIRS